MSLPRIRVHRVLSMYPFLKAKIYQMNKIQSPKNDKPAVLGFIDSKRLISRNIWVAEKWWNVHTVEKDHLWQ